MIALIAAAALSATQPIVQLQQGRISGETLDDGSSVFRGVPFAEPPVGPLRWKPPQPVKSWTAVRDATQTAPACPQPDNGWNKEAAQHSAEDCLYLELRTPDLSPVSPLPVMVWIHGGANYTGSGAGIVMSTIPSHGVVLVSIQYRLGALGFMSHPALSRESATHASGNYALMDQVAALKWVRSNIAHFGGDPANVTIFGESAGGQDVGLLLVTRSARGLFQKAIEESGTPQFGMPPRSLAQNEEVGRSIAEHAGMKGGATARELRAIPAADLVKAEVATTGPGGLNSGLLWSQAIVDGAVLTEAPEATLRAGRQARVPLIIGSNTREVLPIPELTAPIGRDAAGFLRAKTGSGAEKLIAAYGLTDAAAGTSDERFGDTPTQIWSDLGFHCPAAVVARAQARTGAPVWHYLFGYAPEGGPPVFHSAELRYVFNAAGNEGVPAGAPPLQAYWTNFAKSGNPNGTGLPEWPRFSDEEPSYVDFQTAGVHTARALRDQVCRFLHRP